jgi:hypothetical protein
MALNRRGLSDEIEKKEEIKEERKEEIKVSKKEILDVYILRDILSKRGEEGLVKEINKCLTFYEKVKFEESWATTKIIKLKANGIHNAGKWKVVIGDVIELPDFEANRVMKSFPGKFEIIKD